VIWVKRKTKYFCKWGWTQHRVICSTGKINLVISAKRNVILRVREAISASIFVMAGHSRPKDGVASARLCPAIHVFLTADANRRGCPGLARA
jgi:hypothetical protein